MNHKAIVIKQLNEQAAELENQLAATRTAIIALGGFVNGPSKVTGKAVGKGSGKGWPKGKKRGPKSPTPTVASTTGSSVTEAIPADLQKEIDAIKANPKLKGIAVAQAVRKAKLAYSKAQAPTPATTGASLESAAN